MSANNFKATKNGGGSEFPICWTGQDDQGNHFGVSTSGIQASRLDTVSQGAEGDAKLIAALLDRHYSGVDAALQARIAKAESLLRDCVEPVKFCAECSTEDKSDAELLKEIETFLAGAK